MILAFSMHKEDLNEMNGDFTDLVSYLWQNQPIIIILFIGGALLIPLIAIDAYRHRKKSKDKHSVKHHHKRD